jgi:hypothetical protein
MNIRNAAALAFACCFVSFSIPSHSQQPIWAQYGKNAQHTGIVTTGIQAMNAVLWQTPVDLLPPYAGSELFIHYGSPIVSAAGTVVLPVRNGPGDTWPTNKDTYQFEGHNPTTGATLFTVQSDFTDWMPHDWTPDVGAVIDGNNKLYIPGAGGTVFIRSSADAPTASLTRVSFFGITAYNTHPTAYNTFVQICTPLTVDSNNNVYFGFYVDPSFQNATQGNAAGLISGIARISSAGVGTWVSADSVSGGTIGNEVATNCTPAISNDGNYLYIAIKQAGPQESANPELLRLNSSNLSKSSIAMLQGPSAQNGDQTFAYILDDGTATPTVGPDGDVYYGTWWSTIARGFMLHYSADLTIAKTPGAFGWDDTAAIVPASAVPGYTGLSSYLILTKYNNYADPDADGDGQNKVAILDPNGTESWTAVYNPAYTGAEDTDTYTTMSEVETALGPTTNTEEGFIGVREWCINMAAIDVLGHSAVINSEDGHCYRWSFDSSTLVTALNLEPPTGEAYTMTLSGKDGLVYVINNATLFAIWDGVKPAAVSTFGSTVVGGNGTTGTVTLSAPATGPGATIQLSTNNANVSVPATVTIPAGSKSANFTITTKAVDGDEAIQIIASRYGFEHTATLTLTSSSLYALNLTPTVVYGNQTGNATVFLSGAAPTSGRKVTLTSSLPSVSLSTKGFTIAGGTNSAKFNYTSAPDAAIQTGKITATLDDNTTISTTVTNRPALLTGISLSPSDVVGGQSTTLTIQTLHPVPATGDPVAVTYSAHTSGPATVTVGQNNLGTATIKTSASPTTSYTETIKATFAGLTQTTQITVTPPALLSKFTLSRSSIYMTDPVTGTVTLGAAATGNVAFQAIPGDSQLVVTTPVVLKGQTTGTFQIATRPLTSNTAHVSTITVTGGGKSITNSITQQPITVSGLTLSAATVKHGTSATLTITTTQPAGNGDLGVQVRSSNTTAIPVPATVFVPVGTNTLKVTLTAGAVSSATPVTISVILAGVTTTKVITVEP